MLSLHLWCNHLCSLHYCLSIAEILFSWFSSNLTRNWFLFTFFFFSRVSEWLFMWSQEVTSRVFMPLFECPSQRCKINKTKGNLIHQLRASKFLKFQEVCQDWVLSLEDSFSVSYILHGFILYFQAKIQELAEHVPKGHIPRTMTVHFRGELTRKVSNEWIPRNFSLWRTLPEPVVLLIPSLLLYLWNHECASWTTSSTSVNWNHGVVISREVVF